MEKAKGIFRKTGKVEYLICRLYPHTRERLEEVIRIIKRSPAMQAFFHSSKPSNTAIVNHVLGIAIDEVMEALAATRREEEE